MHRIRRLSVVLSPLALIALLAQSASAYGSSTPPVAGKWVAIDKNYEKYWHGHFRVTHGPVTVHGLTFTPKVHATNCDTSPITVVGSHQMHLYSGINPHHLSYTAWAIGRNTPNAPNGYVISPVRVTLERDGQQFAGKLRMQIQFPRGGGVRKTDGSLEYTVSGEECSLSFTVRKT